MKKELFNISDIFKRFYTRITLLVIVALLVSISISEVISYKIEESTEKELYDYNRKAFLKNQVEKSIAYIEYLNKSTDIILEDELKNSVYNAHRIANQIYESNKGKLPDNEIKEIIVEALRPLRFFDTSGYVFIISMDEEYILNPMNPHFEKIKDIKSIPAVNYEKTKRYLDRLKEEKEFVFEYNWFKKPGTKIHRFRKIVYAKLFEPYNWMLAVGEYRDDYKEYIKEKALTWFNNMYKSEKINFFINQYDGKILITSSKTLKRGDYINHLADSTGFNIFEEELKLTKRPDGGFLNYYWKSSKDDSYTPRLAYIKGYDEWGWMIGTSADSRVLEKYIEAKRERISRSAINKAIIITLIVIVMFIIFYYFIKRINDKIISNLNLFSASLSESIREKKTICCAKYYITEIYDLAHYSNKLLYEHLKNISELEVSEHKLKLLIDNAPLMIIGFDKNKKTLIWNKDSEKILGVKQEDAIGSVSIFEQIFENDIAKNIENAIFTENREFKQFEFTLKGGVIKHQYWASFKATSNLIIWMGYDVTPLVNAKKKLVEDTNFLNSLIQNIPTPLFYKDLNCVYQGCNKAFSDLLNRTPEQVKGLSLFDCYDYDLALKFQEKDKELFNKGGIQIYDGELYGKDYSDAKHFTFYKSIFKNREGKTVGLIGTMLDITRRKRYEKMIKENNILLADINKTKDKFFSIIAKDLKVPFNTLIESSDRIIDNINRNKIGDVDSIATKMYTSSRQGFQLLSNLLEWSRSQTGTISYDPKIIPIKEPISNAISLLGNIISNKNLTINDNTHDDDPVFADTNMLSTVMINLISNAVKYTPSGKSISINLENNSSKSYISIADEGVGIEKRNIAKIFKLEESFSTPGTDGEIGTGLGLIICHEFIKKHDGRIDIDSSIDIGTTVTIELPLNNKQN
ncbi:MAG: cache domain-containing protein [Bacteroidales bacterium]|jgi:PAS domain S-box-containing protein|nr:cache domain-containing protein [Bacteroidales bacterium]